MWQWTAGTATTKAEFGDPLTSTDYVLRIYDTSGAVVFAARVPAGGVCGTRKLKPCWKESTSGFSYENTALTPNGILRLVLHAGDAKKARIGVKAWSVAGAAALPLAPPRCQLSAWTAFAGQRVRPLDRRDAGAQRARRLTHNEQLAGREPRLRARQDPHDRRYTRVIRHRPRSSPVMNDESSHARNRAARAIIDTAHTPHRSSWRVFLDRCSRSAYFSMMHCRSGWGSRYAHPASTIGRATRANALSAPFVAA